MLEKSCYFKNVIDSYGGKLVSFIEDGLKRNKEVVFVNKRAFNAENESKPFVVSIMNNSAIVVKAKYKNDIILFSNEEHSISVLEFNNYDEYLLFIKDSGLKIVDCDLKEDIVMPSFGNIYFVMNKLDASNYTSLQVDNQSFLKHFKELMLISDSDIMDITSKINSNVLYYANLHHYLKKVTDKNFKVGLINYNENENFYLIVNNPKLIELIRNKKLPKNFIFSEDK